MRAPSWNTPLVLSVIVTLAYNVAADIVAGWLRENAVAWLADFMSSPWSSLIVLVAVFALLWAIQLQTTPSHMRVVEHAEGPKSMPAATERNSTRSSRWLPDPTDLATLALTNRDLDRARKRSLARAKEALAPDCEVGFRSVHLLPELTIMFYAVSRTAARHCMVQVTEHTEFAGTPKKGSYMSSGANMPIWHVEPSEIAPWRDDPSWKTLVEKAWYRMRPFHGAVVMFAAHWLIEDADQWGLWNVCCTPSEPRDGEAHPVSIGFGLKNGELEEQPMARGGW